MLPEQAAKRIPSLSAAWVRDRQIRWQHAVGTVDTRRGGEPATPDTRYRIGSTTKTFVAVLVMRLVAKGRLGLDDPLGAAPSGHADRTGDHRPAAQPVVGIAYRNRRTVVGAHFGHPAPDPRAAPP